MDSSQKRDRDRRKRQKRQDKESRRKERAENKALRKAGVDLPQASTAVDLSSLDGAVAEGIQGGLAP